MSTRAWKEERRKRAWELYQSGWQQKEIAEALGVSKGAVSQWGKSGKQGGVEALKTRKRPGAPRRLSTEDRQRIPELLTKGAESFGFQGNVWTCQRVSQEVKREFGVEYHPAHMSRILKELDWTPQKPRRRAKQRKEEEIEQWWQECWPEMKKRPQKKGEQSFS